MPGASRRKPRRCGAFVIHPLRCRRGRRWARPASNRSAFALLFYAAAKAGGGLLLRRTLQSGSWRHSGSLEREVRRSTFGTREDVSISRLALSLVLPAAALVVASGALGGGISDDACPNVAGEHTNTCPAGTIGRSYYVRFRENDGSGCGPGRQTFHLDSGTLPPGLALASDGALSGTPVQPGRFRFYVQMREPQDDPATCAGKRTEKQFTLSVRTPPWIVSVPSTSPRSEVGVPFRMSLRARGGTGVFAWSLVHGRLPAGVSLRASGSIVGTPRTAGTHGFTARARDTEARLVIWSGTIGVAARLLIRTEFLRPARVGRFYRADLTAAGGVAPKVWKLTRGRLPRGIRLAPALGRLIGIPREAGRHRVTVEVSDGLGVKSTATFTIDVGPLRTPSSDRPA